MTLLELYDEKLTKGEIVPDADQKNAITALADLERLLLHYKPKEKQSLVDRLLTLPKNSHAPRGFYFYGGVGRGKSMVMDLFFSSIPLAKKRRVHFHAFMLEVHDFLHALRSGRQNGTEAQIDDDLMACADKIAAETWVLCFDEFQVKDVADAMILGRLFTALYERGIVTVMTSNIAPDDLYADGLNRDRFLPFIALMQKKMQIMLFSGETDYRLGRLRDLHVYFTPHDANARAELERIFKTVSDGRAGEPAAIHVKGRVIAVPRAAREVVWFPFSDLCETAKSALDYLELTKRYRVFIIEDVPVLNDTSNDATLRFITLIDTLYEHHALVVISAAETPDKIYQGRENAQTFQRTSSRLMEMQSRKYKEV